MKVGRATHACLATKFGVSLKNFLLTKVVEGLGTYNTIAALGHFHLVNIYKDCYRSHDLL